MDDVIKRLGTADDDARRLAILQPYLAGSDDAQTEVFLTHLKTESEQQSTVDLTISLNLADALVCAAGLAARPGHRAIGLMAKGDTLRDMGSYRPARVLLDEAAAAFLESADEVGWARTRIGWLDASLYLDEGVAALGVVGQVEEIFIRHGLWLRAGAINLNAGAVCYELGRYGDALTYYDRAITFYERAREQPDLRLDADIRLAKAISNKATIGTLHGDFDRARSLQREIRDIVSRHGKTLLVLNVDQWLADVDAGQGHYTRAMRQYREVMAARARHDTPLGYWRVALAIVQCYLGLNHNVEARDLADEAIAALDRADSPTDSAQARFYAAIASARCGQHPRARGLLADAADTFARAGLIGALGLTRLHRARLNVLDRSWQASLDDAAKALDIFVEHGVKVREIEARLVRAWAFLGLDRPTEASESARLALAEATRHDVLWLMHDAHHLLGRVAASHHQLAEALAEYRQAIASVERLQSVLASELRTHFLDDKQPLYHDAIGLSLELGDLAGAFDCLERAKSRALVDYLAANAEVRLHAPDDASQKLLDTLTRRREEHHWLYDRLYGDQFALSSQDDQPDRHRVASQEHEAHALRAAIQDRERHIGRLVEELTLHQAHGDASVAMLPSSRPIDRPALDANTVMLEYFISPREAVVFVVTQAGMSAVTLPASKIEIEDLVEAWQQALDDAARALDSDTPLDSLVPAARAALAALYRALVQPVESDLIDRQRLIVVPHGRTHGLPFHAFHDGERYLLERLTTSVCPSSSLLQLCARRPRRSDLRALIVANSDGGQLPEIVDEARSIASIVAGECYLEAEATRDVLQRRSRHFPIIHLAAHAEARPDNPTLAYLKLADGQFGVIDAFNLELDGALVTLSGCETGRSVVTEADELIGLSRGFLHAGASTLVQSLWRVEDVSTARLMRRFYGGLKEGHSKGKALREAQLDLFANVSAHPFIWAPFQIVGDAGGL